MNLSKLLIWALCLTTLSGVSFGQTTAKRKRVVKKTTVTKTSTSSASSATPTIAPQTAANTALTDTEITGGLKEALFNGVKFAVNSLGHENGFLDNTQVKIPLPNSMQKVEQALRFAGQGKMVDDFVGSMNHAAEKAVPVAIDVFMNSIKQMTFSDVKNLLFSGQNDAATQFFRRTSEETLRGKFRPIVEKFTGEVGVTQKYKSMMGKYGFVGQLLGKDSTDIDGYITQKALDGTFYMVAEEEKKIRRDPIGTGSALLKKVFGAIFK